MKRMIPAVLAVGCCFGFGLNDRLRHALRVRSRGYYPPPMQFRPVEFHPIQTDRQRGFSCFVTRAVRADRDRLSVMDLDTSREGLGGAFFLSLVL
jgi:hypothetical protein